MLYDRRRMKTVLITGSGAPLPGALREIIERGSTSVLERAASELTAEIPADPGGRLDADRIVFWSASDDAAVRRAAERFAAAEEAERRELLVFVTAEEGGTAPSPRLGPNEIFVWPRDEDRLTMAFLTGA
jgi:hypothetical protein